MTQIARFFNVRYKWGELGKELGEICYVTDGYAVSILIPFPMNDESCLDLQRFVQAIMDGPEIFCQAQLEQQVIVSNYRETECPDRSISNRSRTIPNNPSKPLRMSVAPIAT